MAERPEAQHTNIVRPSPEEALAIQGKREHMADLLTSEEPEQFLLIAGTCSLDLHNAPNGSIEDVNHARALDRIVSPYKGLQLAIRTVSNKPRTGKASGYEYRGIIHTPGGQYRASQIAALTDYHTEQPMATETMDSEDFEAVTDQFASIQWIGARSLNDTNVRYLVRPRVNEEGEVQNPIPVLVKNGQGADGEIEAVTRTIHVITNKDLHFRAYNGHAGRREDMTGANPYVGLIWRGTKAEAHRQGDAAGKLERDVREHQERMFEALGVVLPLIVDVSHDVAPMFDDDGKRSAQGQVRALEVVGGLMGNKDLNIRGAMMETNRLSGSDTSGKTRGMSRTDPGVGEKELPPAVASLAEAVASSKHEQVAA